MVNIWVYLNKHLLYKTIERIISDVGGLQKDRTKCWIKITCKSGGVI